MEDDAVGKVFSVLFLSLCIFLIPVIIIFNNIDITQRSYVDEAVNVFVEEVRSTGYISYTDYQGLISQISNGNHVFEVNMLHKSKNIIPVGGGEYRTSYQAYNQEDILESLYNGEDYVMKDGDYFTVSVVSKDDMTGTKYFSILTGSGTGVKIICTAGGMIGNTKR